MGVVIRYLSHASFQIKGGGKVIYVDLEKSSNPVEKADLVLVTHSHDDHCDPEKIREVRTESTVIIAPKNCVSKIGGQVETLAPGGEFDINGIHVCAVEAYNVKRFRSSGNPFHPKGFGVGYVIKVENKTIYHAGDTDFIPEMRNLGNVDVALLPSGDTYTMDNMEAVEAALAVNPKTAIPMHRWSTNPEEFSENLREKSSINVKILHEGEEYKVQ